MRDIENRLRRLERERCASPIEVYIDDDDPALPLTAIECNNVIVPREPYETEEACLARVRSIPAGVFRCLIALRGGQLETL